MTPFFVNLFGDTIGPIMGLVVSIIIVVLLLLLLWTLIKRFRGGLFVSGGRDRRPRLSVLDATPVDSKRRLVLVRCDDDEHLIMIGGPNDLVIHSNAATQIEEQPAKRTVTQGPSAEDLARMAADEAQRSRRTRKFETAEPTPEPQAAPSHKDMSSSITKAAAPLAVAGAGLSHVATNSVPEVANSAQDHVSVARDAAMARLQAAAGRPQVAQNTATPQEPEAPYWSEQPLQEAPVTATMARPPQQDRPSMDDDMDKLLADLQLNDKPQR